jgi:hypothetical protein
LATAAAGKRTDRVDAENVFRQANRQIAQKARSLDVPDEIPFICECSNRGCFRTVRCSVDEFERLLGVPDTFLTLPGHPEPRRIDAAA